MLIHKTSAKNWVGTSERESEKSKCEAVIKAEMGLFAQ